jgi:hypothetical protein
MITFTPFFNNRLLNMMEIQINILRIPADFEWYPANFE